MKSLFLPTLLLALASVSLAVPAQTRVITAPPSSVSSSQTDGVDSSRSLTPSAVTSKDSRFDVNWKFVPSCVPYSQSKTSTGTCPAGQTVNGVGNGPTTFTQTYSSYKTCPNGEYGQGVTGNTAAVPVASTVCATPVVTCVAGNATKTATGTCPAGQTSNGVYGGPTTFSQTYVATTTCPSGKYGAPSITNGTPSPSPSSACSTPPPSCTAGSVGSSAQATCPNGQTVNGVYGGATTFSQSYTSTTTCPGGVYGTPTVTKSTPTPTVASVCKVPAATCTASNVARTQTASCPAGQTVGGVGNGATSFTQSYTTSTTCPSGQYGAPSVTNSTPSPTVSATCSTPVVTCAPATSSRSQSASCPAGQKTVSGSTTFTQNQTVTTSCPGGSYGSPSVSYGSWLPVSNTTTCPTQVTNNRALDPKICAATGGMPYTITPTSLTVGVGAATFAGGAVSYFRGTTTRRGGATGGISFTIAFNGYSQAFSLACTRTNTDWPTITDSCDHKQNFSIGGGTFEVSLSTTSPLAMDWVAGAMAWYSGTATFTQTNCTP